MITFAECVVLYIIALETAASKDLPNDLWANVGAVRSQRMDKAKTGEC